MKNFLKHAAKVGLVTSVIEAAATWLTSVDMHYDDDGCLCSTSFEM